MPTYSDKDLGQQSKAPTKGELSQMVARIAKKKGVILTSELAVKPKADKPSPYEI